jgi:TRAP-type uncharacterized transport system substrate-binding protein
VHITNQADPGWEFDHWSGGASGTSPILDITIVSDMFITAHFSKDNSMFTQFIAARSGFTSISDLHGSNIRAISGDKTWQYAETAISTYGITCNPIAIGSSDVPQAMAMGVIDAVLVTSQNPWHTLEKLIDSMNINLLAWSDKAIQAVENKFPEIEAASLPAGTYKNQRYDIPGYAPK